MSSADVIVIGTGGMGAAAAWRLAQRGLSVIALEQFALGHKQGSSHGHTRIIRQAYYEHPAYVDVCVRAMASEAHRLGARLHENEPVLSWQRQDGRLVVHTTTGRYTADQLVITAGPWAGRLLGAAGRRLTVMRQVVHWLEPA